MSQNRVVPCGFTELNGKVNIDFFIIIKELMAVIL